jgi:hypothetical protein
MRTTFSPWLRWDDRNEYAGVQYPGVYVLAISKRDLSRKAFSVRKEIVYIGMTNAIGGLRSRLKQFDDTIRSRVARHGGADRLLFKHRSYPALSKTLYVAMRHSVCSPARESPSDLRTMGQVAAAEFNCQAQYVEKFGTLPEFN